MFENKDALEVVGSFSSDAEKGLSEQEAQKRLSTYGHNELQEKKKKTIFGMFFGNLCDPMTLILCLAAILSLVLAIINWKVEGAKGLVDVFIIFGVVILNAIIGTIQEAKAEKALDALKKMSSPTSNVIRDGQSKVIPSRELVPGDVVVLKEGDIIPADLRLLSASGLKTDESSLTGESVPVEKDADAVLKDDTPLAERVNEAFLSTFVVHGRGVGVVVATGMKTEIGKIASLLQKEENEVTPLEKNLAKLSKFLGILASIVVVLMMVAKIIWGIVDGNLPSIWQSALLDSIALAVAAIPEGLTAIVTIVLANGVTKMAKNNVVVRKLASVETLGAVTVVCSDKTGTLTQNKMKVVDVYSNSRRAEFKDFDISFKELAIGMALCNDARNEGTRTGDPTEIALLDFASAIGLSKTKLDETMTRVNEIPFDSTSKTMTTMHQVENGVIHYKKGAIERLLPDTKLIYKNGSIEPLDEAGVKEIEKQAKAMSNMGLRVLGLIALYPGQEGFAFVGLTGMIDPPRDNAKVSVEELRGAGVRTIMITGDHPDTAFAIAKQLTIVTDASQVMTGADIDACSEEELAEKVKRVNVFARVSPENKSSIVAALQSNGEIVAMTGDGVNDAPSLKAAHCGIAMGITGTDVAKDAADMILMDDDFSSIVKAVEEGRGIYKNIQKTILFLLSSNVGEIICMFIAALLGLPSPLIAIHLLLVNLVTDSLPGIALGVDKKSKTVMQEKPRDPKDSLFAHGGYALVFGYGALVGVATLTAFLFIFWMNQGFSLNLDAISAYFADPLKLEEAQSMAFCVLSLSQLFHMLGMVNVKKSIIHIFSDKNLVLWVAFLLGLALQVLFIFTPGLNTALQVIALQGWDFLWVGLLMVSPVVVHEIVCLIEWLIQKRKTKAGETKNPAKTA